MTPVHPLVDVQCPECAYLSRIAYRRLGAATLCPGCHARTAPEVPAGVSYPQTQWDLNFRDFLSLIREPDSREQIAPLLDSWFTYRLSGFGIATEIVDSRGQSLDLLTVHLLIQEAPAKQLSIYQTAMSLWR